MSLNRILVVDDDEMMLLFLGEYLGAHYNVESIADPEEALEWLTKHNQDDAISLVVIDLYMPGMDGFTFIERLKGFDDVANTPVLVLSGSEKSEDRVNALRIGAADFLQKPFNPDELKVRVDKLLGRMVQS